MRSTFTSARTSGEKNIKAKLTWLIVEKIRALYPTGKYTQKEMGERFGVSGVMVSYILSEKNWTHNLVVKPDGTPITVET